MGRNWCLRMGGGDLGGIKIDVLDFAITLLIAGTAAFGRSDRFEDYGGGARSRLEGRALHKSLWARAEAAHEVLQANSRRVTWSR